MMVFREWSYMLVMKKLLDILPKVSTKIQQNCIYLPVVLPVILDVVLKNENGNWYKKVYRRMKWELKRLK